jgi:hypothetical protein
MDMLRFHKFTAGKFWVDDYGCADNKDEFDVCSEGGRGEREKEGRGIARGGREKVLGPPPFFLSW